MDSPSKNNSRPFTAMIAEGQAEVELLFFDHQVLERYCRDPRYEFRTSDFSGQFWAKDQFVQAGDIAEEDNVGLQVFGFAHDAELRRAVCVMLVYLARLTTKHQQHWNAHTVTGDFTPHPGFAKPAFLGEWPDGMSVVSAIMHEIHFINQLAVALARPPLFSTDPGIPEHKIPQDLQFLTFPTKMRFLQFVLSLDKLLADNIGRDFFGDDVCWTVNQGKVSRRKGTLEALEEWLRLKTPSDRSGTIDRILKQLRQVHSQQRKEYAHEVVSDDYNVAYLQRQLDLCRETFEALQLLRGLLQELDSSRAFSVPADIERMKVWFY